MGGCAGDPQGDVGCVTAERVVTQKVEEKRKKEKKKGKEKKGAASDSFGCVRHSLPDDK